LAFFLVFCFHRVAYVPKDSWLLPMAVLGEIGAFGVPVFFLLSAYLITELLLREKDQEGGILVRFFYMRRMLRIWPLYFAAIIGLSLLNQYLPGVGTNNRLALWSFTLFTGNWYVSRYGWVARSFDPLWSISVEEQFYLAILVIAALGGEKVLRLGSMAVLSASYATILFYALHPRVEDSAEWTNSLVQFQFFSAGTLIALILRGRSPDLTTLKRWIAAGLAFGCWLVAKNGLGVSSWNSHPRPLGAVVGWLLALFGTMLLFLAFLGVPAHRIPRWLAYFGRISFGLYIFHSLVFVLVFEKCIPWLHADSIPLPVDTEVDGALGTAAALMLTLLLAHFSYRYYERLFLQHKKRFTLIPSREEAPTGGLP
jgi:peptidoglycan/LPS O-acetylase OafA/YrhL